MKREKDENLKWEFLRFIIFDVPDPLINSQPYEIRFSSLLQNYTSIDGPIISCTIHYLYFILFLFDYVYIPAANKICVSKQHLKIFTKFILNNGGEGTVIRQPKSFYQRGKTNTMYKVKVIII